MICPACGHPTHVVDSREYDGKTRIRRRRACSACGHRVTTRELTKEDLASQSILSEEIVRREVTAAVAEIFAKTMPDAIETITTRILNRPAAEPEPHHSGD